MSYKSDRECCEYCSSRMQALHGWQCLTLYILFSLISAVRPFIACFLSRPRGFLLMWGAGLWLFLWFSMCCFWYSLFSARYDTTLWSQVQWEICTRVEMSERIYYRYVSLWFTICLFGKRYLLRPLIVFQHNATIKKMLVCWQIHKNILLKITFNV